MAKMLVPFAKMIFGFGIPITVMLMFIQGCYSPKNETVIFDLGFAKFCEEGALYALKIITTLLVFLGTFYIMNKTTRRNVPATAGICATSHTPSAPRLFLHPQPDAPCR